MVFRRWRARYSKWKLWRQYTWFGKLKQWLILFGLVKSDYFDSFRVLEDDDEREKSKKSIFKEKGS